MFFIRLSCVYIFMDNYCTCFYKLSDVYSMQGITILQIYYILYVMYDRNSKRDFTMEEQLPR